MKPLLKNISAGGRGDDTRRRLIEAGMVLFGSKGYEATTTRTLADEAGVNLAAIPYHFGGKDGLYMAVAQAVIEKLGAEMGGFLTEVEREIEQGVASPHQAMALIERLMADFAEVVLMRPDAEHWLCFLMREQMEPTDVFPVLYESPVKRMRVLMVGLLSIISGLDASSVRLRLTAVELLGLVYVFRVARASVLREMGWSAIDEANFIRIRGVILDNTRLILKGLQG